MTDKQTDRRYNDGQYAKRSKSRAGSTLLESLLALSIFAVFATGTSRLLVSHRIILDKARDHYTAANIAKNRMELIRTMDFDQIPKLSEIALRIDDEGTPSGSGHFQRVTTITTVNTNLYELAINVKILNRETLKFDGGEEILETFVAKHL